jgi:hypothetical protein
MNFKSNIWEYMDDNDKVVGCSPDMVYSDEYCGTVSPIKAKGTSWCAGGHIHIGWESPTEEQKLELAKRLATSFITVDDDDPAYEDECRRVEVLQAGLPFPVSRVRMKPYGIEWRNPSNLWVSYPDGPRRVFNEVTRFVSEFLSGKETKDIAIIL